MVLFLAAAGAAFLAWLVATQLVLLSAAGEPRQVEAFLLALPDALPNFGFVAAGVAAVLFFSTLMDRSFAAVVAGAIVVAAAIWGWREMNWTDWEIDANAQRAGLVAAGIALVFVAASAAAFVRGPAHGPALRRALVGVAVPLGVFVPAGFASAVALDHRMKLEPGDTDCRIMEVHPSPDGTHLALQMRKDGLWNSEYLWIVRVADGRVVARPESNLRIDAWSDDGTLRAWSCTRKGTSHGSFTFEFTLMRWIDAETADVVRTRSREQWYEECAAKPPKRGPWSLVSRPNNTWLLRETATGATTPFPEAGGPHPYARLSPSGRYVSVAGRTGGSIVGLSPRRVLWTQKSDWFGAEWIRGFGDDRYVLVTSNGEPARIVDLEASPPVAFEPEPLFKHCNAESVAAAPGGGFFIVRQGDHVDLAGSDGRTIRRVYPPDR
jgi:hypothetical protein